MPQCDRKDFLSMKIPLTPFEAIIYTNCTIKCVVIWDTLISLAEREIKFFFLSTVSLYDRITSTGMKFLVYATASRYAESRVCSSRPLSRSRPWVRQFVACL